MIGSAHRARHAFTLIELSIVLVIIALLVGVIVVGQNLIQSATLRSAISQTQKFQTAINAFRGKYNYLPGDVPGDRAASFDLYGSGSNAFGLGNADGTITATNATSQLQGEVLIFWRHLSDARLTEQRYGDAISASTAQFAANTAIGSYVPLSKLGSSIYYGIGTTYPASDGYNYLVMAAIPDISASQPYTVGISPLQAYGIDVKMDDGLPGKGVIQTKGIGPFSGIDAPPAWSTATASSAAAGDCVTGGSSATDIENVYATSITGNAPANNPNCTLRIRLN